MDPVALRHRRSLERLAKAPWIIGLDDAIGIRVEQPVYRASGEPLGDVDLLVGTSSGLVIVEYKLGRGSAAHEPGRRHHAADQLARIGACVEERLDVRPRMLYVHGPRFGSVLIEPGDPSGPLDLAYVAAVLEDPEYPASVHPPR